MDQEQGIRGNAQLNQAMPKWLSAASGIRLLTHPKDWVSLAGLPCQQQSESRSARRIEGSGGINFMQRGLGKAASKLGIQPVCTEGDLLGIKAVALPARLQPGPH